MGHGEPLWKTTDGVAPTFMQSLCGQLGSIDLAMLDPQGTELGPEWQVLDKFCRPRVVAIHNANLPEHAGWLRPHLLESGAWIEVLNGSHPSLWERGVRSWTLL